MWVVSALVIVYFVGLLLHGDGANPFVDVWLCGLTQWGPVVVFFVAAWRTHFARRDVLLAAAAVTVSAVADTYYSLFMDDSGYLVFPSLADIGYLMFYPLMLAAVVVLVRRQVRGFSWSVLLDGAVGSLGAAAVLAAILSPVLEDAIKGPTPVATAVAVAYPFFDLLLVAVITGIAAAPTLDIGPRWLFLFFGLGMLTVADVAYALLENADQYSVGNPLDAVWALGLALMALWVDGSGRNTDTSCRRQRETPPLSVPAGAVVAGLGLLVLGTQITVSVLAVVLATATVGLAALPLAFRQRLLRRESLTDELTGLPNRRALKAEAETRFKVGSGSPLTRRRSALMLLDLDRFKEVNDSLGHDAGDTLLVQVSTRLSRSLGAGDFLARLGGDEFAIILQGSGEEDALAVARKLRAALAAPFTLENIALQTSASMGIALFPDQGQNLGELLRRADMAMYEAKTTHSGHHVFKQADDSHGEVRLRTLEELRVALLDDQLVVHYQPKINLKTGHVTGVEALVRWNHPSRGLLLPEEFLILVEESGQMAALTRIVLEKALDQAQLWQTHDRAMTVAVNLSSSSFVDIDLPERIAAMIDARQLSASTLILEITEDFLMADRERARTILTRLREGGVQIAIDDFGTGYSSLSYLRDLPIDEIKLDQSFVLPMGQDPRAAALVASTIDLAHSLGLRMVAEGVENSAAYDELVRYGCDHAQGFFMSGPVPAAELDNWIANQRVEDIDDLVQVNNAGASTTGL
ncbi:EAL domain-containing protein [Cryobacterium adonitolivorans]|uniref:EAL domain-containing protein n=1 Tax=Cryobacterium adonitolivorans TaxID=1259189 RepID=A0A4R8WBK8_9MICO|nr:EAL domain-containing protein [Cryobacterium adonitolivorans]TFC05529.1 EAL domain-containing protein [Cryobacterium adonitolivorans]